ncbi:hypothetical protein [Teredinibacter sp. KSP-S5-2]|uniref:hypothetical protein n=1 Tax=Teredinibacter sp. KSP-S5-2 TaxID=3034506 RepID=UPI00293488F2|nr:hypothetical protein [Teredinibacter sp. KSP-S5-2]WNO08296.1 hypothetical protein P5V12_15095 [Teredinibacter sp. KSP-S5-2]
MAAPIFRLQARIKKLVHQSLPNFLIKKMRYPCYSSPEIIWDSSPNGKSGMDYQGKKIFLNIHELEHLWCANYAFYSLFERSDTLRLNARRNYDITKNKYIADAIILYNKSKPEKKEVLPWHLVKSNYRGLPIEAITDTLFIHSLEYLLSTDYVKNMLCKFSNIDITDTKALILKKKIFTSLVYSSSNKITQTRRAFSYIAANLLQATPDLLYQSNNQLKNVLKAFEDTFQVVNHHYHNENHPTFMYLSTLLNTHLNGEVILHTQDTQSWKQFFKQQMAILGNAIEEDEPNEQLESFL